MTEYEKAFTDSSQISYSPYLMYSNPRNYRSAVVNTDAFGLRFCRSDPQSQVNSSQESLGQCNILIGSSTVFGIGASADSRTIASFMEQETNVETLNLGGRSYNSIQELLFFYQFIQRQAGISHKRIISLTGFNDLALSQLSLNSPHQAPAFFMQNAFNSKLSETKGMFGHKPSCFNVPTLDTQRKVTLDERIEYAARVMGTYIDLLGFYCAGIGAQYVFALQPLANWLEKEPSDIERRVFSRLEEAGSFEKMYGDITNVRVYMSYEEQIREHCRKRDVQFLSVTQLLNQCALSAEDSLFVDRIHFNDSGNELVAKLILKNIHK